MKLPTTYSHRLTDSRLANMGATLIHDAFISYCRTFHDITGRAQQRFEDQDWNGVRTDARERLELYRQIINQIVPQVRRLLADRLLDKIVWAGMKAVYSGFIENRDDWELAETFFNSVTRRIFTTVGVDPQIEFVATDFDLPPTPSNIEIFHTYRPSKDMPQLMRYILQTYEFQSPFADLDGDCCQIAQRVRSLLIQKHTHIVQIDMAKRPFYRGKSAYLIGRLLTSTAVVPFVMALLHEDEGLFVDSVLLDESSVSILFSFARSYFHVLAKRPYDLVQFIRSIIPRKRVAEIYISLGYHKHGKTELYRNLLHHLAHSRQRFQISPGQRGMVMTVFTLPEYDMVFKVIKDRFSYPKTTTRKEVIAKYELVFHHDRAGRLIDAQTFEHLQFSRDRFAPDLLAELLKIAGQTIQIAADHIIVSHAYMERRVTPLDIYLHHSTPVEAEAAVLEYGRAIKDLAATNIFPGDMLLKNFGVTRHGRVVFYDYDELRPLLGCNFRKFPQSQYYEDDLADEPWFHVGEHDIFPEEFLHFMGLPTVLEETFLAHHSDLLQVDFWQEMQARLQNGELISIRPYADTHKLTHS
ncbi:MAG: bifunctional isocitrate dehydrogenase kinase/phosphatase [Chloroflexi bacterium]|nr:bifunctional isocitrate dehydrogenase kinase/phosphatase [Chloroflexota bacterium]